ncbi:MAG: protein kinase [Pseudomonadota bacterium]
MKICRDCGVQMVSDAAFCPECGKPQLSEPETVPQQTLSGLQTIGPGDLGGQTLATGVDLSDVKLEPGTIFADRFEIQEQIGEGGMGVVYHAKDTLTGKSVALKLLTSRLIGSEAAAQRLITEGALAQDIRHENIVSVYDVGRAGDQIYVSMEYVDGVSLRAWISNQMASQNDVPLRVASRIIAEILDGLKVAHARDVVHRDLSPENIILLRDPDEKSAPLKILDFGIARAASTTTGGQSTSGALGKFDYMAPEQRTNPDSAGPSADLYSVSKMFYEILVGVLPTGHWQPPSGGRTDILPGIDVLIEQGLSNRPQNRPQSAADYRQSLVDILNGKWSPHVSPIRPSPAVPSPQPRRKSSSSGGLPPWAIWSGGGGLALVMLLGLIGVAAGGGDQTQPPGTDLSFLSGSWDDGPVKFSVNVSRSGDFRGTGRAPNGEMLELSGYLPASGVGDYAVVGLSTGAATFGTVSWPGDCHVNYSFDNTMTGRRQNGQFHIDHPASSSMCPPRFR